MTEAAIGIDVGGTNIKGAAVDLRTGERITTRVRVPTPGGGTPDDIAHEVAAMVQGIRAEFDERVTASAPATLSCASPHAASYDALLDTVGVALPSAVRNGVALTAANIDARWINTDAAALLADASGSPCVVVNDADAAGIAEAALGAAKGVAGTVLVLTFGTGIGSACLSDGMLVPNFELGHLHLDGHSDAERWASARAIAREGITLAEWAQRAGRYLQHVEDLLHPQRFVLGGSISKDSAQYLPFAEVSTPTVPARFHNDAGIIGAALIASGYSGSS